MSNLARTSSVSPAAINWPPSAEMISTIVRYADSRKDIGDGRTLLRITGSRLAEAAVTAALGADTARAAEIGVVWSERDEQIVRIIDDSLVKRSLAAWWEDYFDRFDEVDPCAKAA